MNERYFLYKGCEVYVLSIGGDYRLCVYSFQEWMERGSGGDPMNLDILWVRHAVDFGYKVGVAGTKIEICEEVMHAILDRCERAMEIGADGTGENHESTRGR